MSAAQPVNCEKQCESPLLLERAPVNGEPREGRKEGVVFNIYFEKAVSFQDLVDINALLSDGIPTKDVRL